MTQENPIDPVSIATLVITGIGTVGKLITDGIAAAGARGQALHDLATQAVAALTHQIEQVDPDRFAKVFAEARAALKAKFTVTTTTVTTVEATTTPRADVTKPGG